VIATTCDGDGAGERACVGLGELCEAAPWSRSWAWERTAGSFADIDGDGVLDFVIASPASGLTIRWGDEFGDAYLHLLAGGAADARAVDVDDDGDLDLVLATEAAPQLRVLENTGSRSFVESRAVTLPGAAQGLWIGPLRPGGDPRVIATTRRPGGVHVFDRRLAPIEHAELGR